MMVLRAIRLRKAIEMYIMADPSSNHRLAKFKLSETEWEQAEAILTLLAPFKRTSVRMQETMRPKLEQVFWVYEILYDGIDKMIESLSDGPLSGKP